MFKRKKKEAKIKKPRFQTFRDAYKVTRAEKSWIGWALIALAMIGIGIPLSILLVGIPAVVLGAAILCSLSLFFALRCVIGLVYLAQGKPYPRPQTWLI